MASVAATDSASMCGGMADFAGNVMEARQTGAEAAQMINVIRETGIGASEFFDPEYIILRAYETPRYSSASAHKRAVTDYKNETYVRCRAQLNNAINDIIPVSK